MARTKSREAAEGRKAGMSRLTALLALAIVVAACGGPGESDGVAPAASGGESQGDEATEDLGQVLGAGGGGVLTFDGEEIPIASVVCSNFEDVVDVGTISESGHRVLIGTNSSANPISAQILDPNGVQWFPQDVSGDEAQRDGNTYTSESTPYFNNVDDRIVQASFTVECP